MRRDEDNRRDYHDHDQHDQRQRDNFPRRHEEEGQDSGNRYRFGEDDLSYRNRGGQSRNREEDDRRGQHRDWNQRREEYGYGRHNYDVFGHEVNRGRDQDRERLTRGDRGDYESYRRYEHNNPNYDNDYTTGFAGRNYSDRPHYGEDTRYGANENLSGYDSRDQGRGRSRQDRSQANDRGRGESYSYYDRNSGSRER